MIVFKIQRKLNELEVFISTEDILDTMINIIDNQLSPDYKSILEKKVVHDHLRIILKDISKATIDNHLDKNNYLYN
ncbi:MAG: hypothetical protein P1U46_03160 [Patescibacteria group bacterium]|nr:hypothetical protein [Patescibacteria group bacterium]